jgi:molybdate/tungstate transport system ATP-binding protein
MIRVHQLAATLGTFALRDISFDVPAGGIAVLTGPTGAGKTTLMEIIAGVRRHDSGAIELDRRDVTHLPPEQRRVGLVYQHAMLFPHLTVRDNIRYGAGAVTDAVFALLPIEPLLEKPLATLSGGERQLVALARTLATRPRVLLLDEPFAAMDPELRRSTRDAVLRWARDNGTTVLLITHDSAEASLLGAAQFRMDAGVVRELSPSGRQEPLP